MKYDSKFKIINLAMAIAAAKVCGLKSKKIFKSLKKIKDIDGRLELVRKFPNNIKVFVDYAHTPDALLKVLQSLESLLWKQHIFSFWMRW